jgi:FtsH-binding integral membrane protein
MYATATYRDASAVNTAMGRVYFHMMLAVVTSMVVSMLVASSPALMQFFFTGWMKWVTIFAPLAAVFGVTIALNSNPPKSTAVALLHGFAAIMGLSFAAIFVVYTLGSIVSAFMGGAVLFAVMSFYGYFTKQSLDSLGKFMFVGLIAVIIASIINLFIGSSVLQMVISAIAIVVFLGLTAYDTQQIREAVSMEDSTGTTEVVGALTLYLDFINLFLSLLQLLGGRKE